MDRGRRSADEMIIFANDDTPSRRSSFSSREEFLDETGHSEFNHRPTMQAPSSKVRPNVEDYARQRSLVDVTLDQSSRGIRGFDSSRSGHGREDPFCASVLRGIVVSLLILILLYIARSDSSSDVDAIVGGAGKPVVGDNPLDLDTTTEIALTNNTRFDAMRIMMLYNDLTSAKDLSDTTSDAYAAAMWLADTDSLQLQPDNSSDSKVEDHDELLERYALVKLFYSMFPKNEQDAPSSWLNRGGSFCTWNGIKCHSGATSVKNVVLNKKFLEGTVPSEIGALSRLEEFELSTNQLHGPIPTTIGRLRQLKLLVLYNNFLTGTIPTEIAGLNDLTAFLLFTNQLSGSLPTELNLLANLNQIRVEENLLSGMIPPLDRLKNLSHFHVHSNELNGPIPPDMFATGKLATVSFAKNFFSGTIPAEMEYSTLLRLANFETNNLDGEIPEVFNNLDSLEKFYISENKFAGPLPISLGKATKLKTLFMDGNQLESPIPLEWQTLSNLEVLVMHSNKLNGHLPPTLGGLSSLRELWLNNNEFWGHVPTEIGLLQHLQEVHLEKTSVNGEVPTELGNLVKMEVLYLHDTALTGVMPEQVCNLFNKTNGKLEELAADCTEVECECCNKCYYNTRQ